MPTREEDKQRKLPTERPELNLNLGDDLGITYDEQAIRSRFDAATEAEFDVRHQQHGMAQDQFSRDLYGQQMNLADMMRRQRQEAISTGASRGLQSAQDLSSMLGMQQQGLEGATQLAQEQALLGDEEGAAYAANIRDAMTQSNELKQAMGALGVQDRASDVQWDVGAMDADARKYQADKGLEGMEYQADRTLEGQEYQADKGLEAAVTTAMTQLEGTKYQADAQKEMNELQQTTNLEIANVQSRTDKYVSDNNLEGTMFEATIRAASNEHIAQIEANAVMEAQRIAGMWQYETADLVSAREYNAAVHAANQQLVGTQYHADALKSMNFLDNQINLRIADIQRDTQLSSDQTRLEEAQTYKEGQIISAAVSGFYTHKTAMETMPPEFTETINKAIQDGNKETYLSMVMNEMGVSKKEAEEMYWAARNPERAQIIASAEDNIPMPVLALLRTADWATGYRGSESINWLIHRLSDGKLGAPPEVKD